MDENVACRAFNAVNLSPGYPFAPGGTKGQGGIQQGMIRGDDG